MENKDLIAKRLCSLRRVMDEKNIDAVIVPTGDPHMSEYECEHYRCLSFITGFAGSDGTAVIMRDEALVSGLWTDSRYFLQAEQQLSGSGIRLFKIGMPETMSIADHIICQLLEVPRRENSSQHGMAETRPFRVACDGRVVNFDTFASWYDALTDAGIDLVDDMDLIAEIWQDRPPLPCAPVYAYDIKYAGRSRRDKLADIGQAVAGKGADAFLLTKTDDICWLLNIRGSDIHCTPVPLCYLILYADPLCGTLFINEASLPDDLRKSLLADGIDVAPYESVSEAVRGMKCPSVLLSTLDTNSFLYTNIPGNVYIIEDSNPTELSKAVKNPVEIACARHAHLKDGIAVTKFICWLKKSVKNASLIDDAPAVTEISAAEKLFELRSRQDDFVGNSFDPIIAYGQHAAIVHYQADQESASTLEPSGLLLADTGGQYLDGTTDVTRTIALGPVTGEERLMSTMVLKGHISLAAAIFPRGLNGANLDYLAHAPLWKMGKDYGHGTGHGVGHFLSVHEGPNNIHWTRNGAIGTTPAFEAGMITSCEPGYYEAGRFGIRHESLILCKPYLEGGLLCFEELTLVPFDLDAIEPALLTDEERVWLNDYHEKVYENIAPHLTDEEQDWLREATRSI